MEKKGFKVKRASSIGGVIRRTAIFVLVAAAAGTGIWYLLPQQEKNQEPPAPAVPPEHPVLPAPAAEPEQVQDEKALEISTASKTTPVPAEDPETTVEKKETAPPADKKAKVEPQQNVPVRKGVAHVTDPADEEPYTAPDLVPTDEFNSRLEAIRKAGNSQEQIAKLQALIKETAFSSPQFREAAKVLNEFNRSRQSDSVKRTVYEVKSGDGLIRLARKFHISTARLAAENGLEMDAKLKIGQKLQVPETIELWSIRISKRARLLRLFREKELFAVYDVGIGRRNLTPEGYFILRETVDNPPYPLPEGGMAKPGSPENQLGPCWLGLGDSNLRSTGYGIHGTPDETSVTRNLSAGCVRMRNKEVLELRTRVPVGTPVTIEN